MTEKEMSKRDLNVLRHPYTQMKDHEFLPMMPIRSGKGVLLRPLGDTVCFMPPYIICEGEMDLMSDTAYEAMGSL